MEIVKHTTEWVNGEVLQGKIMVAIAMLFLVAWVAIFRSQNELFRGALIPMALMVLVLGGYGGFQVFSRPGHIAKVEKVAQDSNKRALAMEMAKAEKDHKAYSTLMMVWPILIMVSALLTLLLKEEFYKGLGIGLVALFLTGLLLDSTLHHRLKDYKQDLTELMAS